MPAVEGFTAIEQHRTTGDRNYRCNTCGWRTGFVKDGSELERALATHQGPHPKDRLDLLLMGEKS